MIQLIDMASNVIGELYVFLNLIIVYGRSYEAEKRSLVKCLATGFLINPGKLQTGLVAECILIPHELHTGPQKQDSEVLNGECLRYVHGEEAAEDQEETGWKYLHGDEFWSAGIIQGVGCMLVITCDHAIWRCMISYSLMKDYCLSDTSEFLKCWGVPLGSIEKEMRFPLGEKGLEKFYVWRDCDMVDGSSTGLIYPQHGC
ncbi:hypothetical protein Ancab_007866 [Ancistrocladus abbreviatus]